MANTTKVELLLNDVCNTNGTVSQTLDTSYSSYLFPVPCQRPSCGIPKALPSTRGIHCMFLEERPFDPQLEGNFFGPNTPVKECPPHQPHLQEPSCAGLCTNHRRYKPAHRTERGISRQNMEGWESAGWVWSRSTGCAWFGCTVPVRVSTGSVLLEGESKGEASESIPLEAVECGYNKLDPG